MAESVADVLKAIASAANPAGDVIVTVVFAIGGFCNDVHEAKALCEQHYGRIKRIQDHFKTLNDANQLPASDVIQLYRTILQTTYKELHAYKEMRFLQRLINYRRLKKTLAQLNVDLVDLYGSLPLVAIGQVAELRQEVAQEAKRLEDVIRDEFAKNANQFYRELGQSTPQAQAEAFTLLKHEEKKYKDGEPDQPVETQETINDALIYLVGHSRGDLRSPPVWFIVATDISIGDDLDSGSFANIRLGKWKGAPVVIKMVLPKDNGLDEPTRRQFITEADVWFTFDHPNVLKMFGACHLTRKPFIVCEYSRDGNLSSYFSKHRRAAKGNKRMWKLLVEAARGLEHIHSKNVVHGDLKLNNLLIGDDGQARLADFGLSRVKMTSQSFVSELPDGAAVDGGLRWMAPERFSNIKTSYYSDIYSFGMCIVEALLGHPPYGTLDNADVRAKIIKGELPERPAQATDDMWDLVLATTKMTPSERMPLKDVIVKLEEFADAEDVEIRLNTVVCTNCNERPPASSNFCNMCRAPLTDAAVELAAVDLAPGSVTSLPPLGNVLTNLKSESKSTQALKFLSRYTAADSSACRQATVSLSRLRDVVLGSSDVVRILYAFACLKNITQAGFGGIEAAELEEIRVVADQKTRSATSILAQLFTPSADAKRDDQQLLELIELFLVVDPNNHHPAGELVTPLAKMLKDSSRRIRDGCVGALAAIVLTGVETNSTTNLEFLTHEDVVTDVVSSLLLVLDGSESSVKPKAIHVLAEITKSRSAATLCANRRAIDIILQVLRRENDASYDHALRVIANLAETTGVVQLIGGRGVVVDLVDLLKEGGADDRTQLAFNVLARLVKDEGNAAQFKRAGGVDALETMLSQESRRGDTLKNLASMTEKSDHVRREIASSSKLLTECVTAMKSGTDDEKICAARVCRELVKESAAVVRQLRSAGGIDALEVLARSGNEFASKALTNAIATQEKALIAAGVLEAPSKQIALMNAGVSRAMQGTANTA